jgi:ribonuclease BN (tRNA processing enzyme)
MHSFSLRCFGVGDGWPSPRRDHSSFLYRFKEQTILIDCGEPISCSYKASGLDYNLIDRIFISHLHFDHVGGFFMLMQGFWLEGRSRALEVHVPADGIEPMRQLLQAGCIFDELLPFPIRYWPLQAGQPIAGDGMRIAPFPTTHLWRLRDQFQTKHPQRFEAFSFLIETAQFRVAHSADIGRVEDLAPLVEKPLDLLVVELAHIAPKELFKFLQGRQIGRILFIHLAREYLENFQAIESLAREMLGACPIGWPASGQEFFFEPAVKADGTRGALLSVEGRATRFDYD